MIHDTHIHLDLYDNIPELVKEIENFQISTIFVTNLPILFKKIKSEINSKYIHVSLGFHPELILEYKKYILNMWEEIDKVKLIGEVGLNLSDVSKENQDIQLFFFRELIQRCNRIGGKILNVHSRGSDNQIQTMIPPNFNGKIILHWYSGNLENMNLLIGKGCYFSVNFSMINSEKGKRIISRIPRDRILLESDGPFIKVRKEIVHPKNLLELSSKVAAIHNLEISEFESILDCNFSSLFAQI